MPHFIRPASATGGVAIGAIALGSFVIGALTVGALAIRRLAIHNRPAFDDLSVRDFTAPTDVSIARPRVIATIARHY